MTDVVLVDEKDKIISNKERYEAHKNPVPLHRAISVVIYDKKGKKMLLQKRAADKLTWPLFWSNTCCTHPLPNETYLTCAKRRLKEEMGIVTPLKELFYFIYDAMYDRQWGEHELDHVFIGKYSGKVVVDPKEAADYKWMDIEKLKKDTKENPDSYTPWFKIILTKLAKIGDF
jgi:isopentenyl-diphosphate delta-isomerase